MASGRRAVPRTAWRLVAFLACLLLGATPPLAARGTYQTPEDFVAEAFGGEPPPAEKLWLRGDLKSTIEQILGRPYGKLRLTYWLKADRSAWILEEIGKEELITTGFVVGSGGIERVRVLIFRESRGFEVRYPAFTRQFEGAHLATDSKLDRHIDGISGATLSVAALTKLARLALLLHQHVTSPQTEP